LRVGPKVRTAFGQLRPGGPSASSSSAAGARNARTPTNGFYRIDGPSSQHKPFLLKYRGNDIRKEWTGEDVEVVALLAWAEIRMPIVEVNEADRIARPSGNPRHSNKERDERYWIENSRDALDAPGE